MSNCVFLFHAADVSLWVCYFDNTEENYRIIYKNPKLCFVSFIETVYMDVIYKFQKKLKKPMLAVLAEVIFYSMC